MRDEIDRPVPHATTEYYGSDAIADMMRELGTPYVALNPGSSFRGLHDSLVNHHTRHSAYNVLAPIYAAPLAQGAVHQSPQRHSCCAKELMA